MTLNEKKILGKKISTFLIKNSKGPGSKIATETELAKHFHVSRYQIRNVLNGFVQQGIITKTPGRGTIINKMDARTLSDNIEFNYRVTNLNLYEAIEARIVMEVAIIPLVVKRLTPVLISELEACIARMSMHKQEPEIADKADMDFHATLFKASGNTLLTMSSQIVIQLFFQADYRQKYWTTETVERLAKEHKEILDAIQDGNTELAVERLKKHLNYTNKIILNGLQEGQLKI